LYKLRKEATLAYKNYTNDLMSLARINPSIEPQIDAVINRLNTEIKQFELLIPKKVKKEVVE
jgi:hypothetical protein